MVAGMVGLVGGCAALPVSGPTGSQVVRQAHEAGGFRLVEVSGVAALPVPGMQAAAAAAAGVPVPPSRASDTIGPGDVLDIQVYEAGVTLFAGSASRAGSAGAINGYAGAAQAERLPPARVDDGGLIRLPYVGPIRAAGRTPGEMEGAIRSALKGMSQNPQVVVSFARQVSNSVIVGGEVGRPGRLELTGAHEDLSDVIALAGGWRGESRDLAVKLSRGDGRVDLRLSDVIDGAARAIFVFRLETGADGVEAPVVYHLDMMRGGSFFLAQRFAMQDKDVLYVGNAAANQPGKLVQLISQLFSPVVAVQGTLVAAGVVR